MTTAEAMPPVNGNYAGQAYDNMTTNYNNSNANNSSSYGATQPSSNQTADPIPKDEVGWYFVEQYYTTLSKSPEKLYLFYNKRSQFVSGTEEDKIPVCIGQKAINDKIKELDFHDCKVRVTNVDSQGSDTNIVIQVIGEISNKGKPHKRFAQTFVLAEQTNGYFVLNDIFRYLAEEPEEEEEQLQQDASAVPGGIQEPVPTAAVPEGEQVNHSAEMATTEEDVAKVDHKLEEVLKEEEPAGDEDTAGPAEVNGTPAAETTEEAQTEETPVPEVSAPEEEALAKEAEAPTEQAALEPEKPKDPAPSPAPQAQKPSAPVVTPAAPAKLSWASMAASANKVATPNVPRPTAAQASSQPKSTTPQSQPSSAPTAQPTSAPAREASPANSQGESTGWQMAGAGHKKEQSRSQNQAPAAETEGKRAYIKNVYSQVEESALKSVLSKFGDIEYCDISRQKNCAFVDFKTPAGFQNAVSHNPHTINGLELKVEERRLRPGPNQFPFQRGGARGRGGPIGGQSSRGAFQRGGRGGSMGRGRGSAQEA